MNGAFDTPTYNKRDIIPTAQGYLYQYRDTLRCCPGENGVYTVVKKDSMELLKYNDRCESCNEPWFKHFNEKSDEER